MNFLKTFLNNIRICMTVLAIIVISCLVLAIPFYLSFYVNAWWSVLYLAYIIIGCAYFAILDEVHK